MTAYLVGYRHGGGGSWNVHFNGADVALNHLPDAGTAPGQVADVKIAKSSQPAAEWKLQALMFADGTAAADRDAIKAIVAARARARISLRGARKAFRFLFR